MREDKELIKLVKENQDNDAFMELMERHSGIFHQTLSNYLPPSLSSSECEDIFQEKPTYFFEAIDSFDESRNAKFVTWLANKTRYSLLSLRSKEKLRPPTCEFNEILGGASELSPTEYFQKKNDSEEILKLVLDKYGEEFHNIFKEKYFGGDKKNGKTFAEIAKGMGISPQAVQAKHRTALSYLQKKLS